MEKITCSMARDPHELIRACNFDALFAKADPLPLIAALSPSIADRSVVTAMHKSTICQMAAWHFNTSKCHV